MSSAKDVSFTLKNTTELSCMPKAYLENQTRFCGLDFYVDERVYVPNPETELLVEHTAEFIRRNKLGKGTFVDVGTGCGNIAISLAKQFPNATIIATDISEEALNVALFNIKKHNTTNISLLHTDLVNDIHVQPDLIIADLPWGDEKHLLATNTKSELNQMPEVAVFCKNGIIGEYANLCSMVQKKGWNLPMFFETGSMDTSIIESNLPKGVSYQHLFITNPYFHYSIIATKNTP